ncbi:carbon-nitrogen hydrolase family protein [Thermoplasma sp.]|uniref:carbon-nitrogen hydrolase family protein n=1 Tax=Thermoplasma sp. TaxID=1973142 RepID=UPI0026331C37|nr:carbon-nitrogen hydrolase family protein [Thermoplasma sp.]
MFDETITITGFQLRRTEKARALDAMKESLRETNSDMIIFPEKWTTEEYKEDEILSVIESLDIGHIPLFIPGSFSISDDDILYNRSYLFHYGKLIGHQDKISLYADESRRYTAGSSIRVFSGDGLSIGISICYDIDFPYYSKVLMREGCNMIVNPSLIRSNFTEEWHLYVSARSLENRVPVISINSLSEPFGGHSIAVLPYKDGTGYRIRKAVASDMKFDVTLNIKDYEDGRIRRFQEDPGTYSFAKIEVIKF